MSTDIGCEAAVTARTIFGWSEFQTCSKLLHGERYPLQLNGFLMSYVSPTILYASEVWCLNKYKIGVLQRK